MMSIYALKNAKKDFLPELAKEGIFYNKREKIYDIVINVPKLIEKIVKDLIKKLSKITNVKYKLKKSIKRKNLFVCEKRNI